MNKKDQLNLVISTLSFDLTEYHRASRAYTISQRVSLMKDLTIAFTATEKYFKEKSAMDIEFYLTNKTIYLPIQECRLSIDDAKDLLLKITETGINELEKSGKQLTSGWDYLGVLAKKRASDLLEEVIDIDDDFKNSFEKRFKPGGDLYQLQKESI